MPIMIIGNAVLKSLTVKYFKNNSWHSQGLIIYCFYVKFDCIIMQMCQFHIYKFTL